MGISTVLNNTILIPASDGLASTPLPELDLASKLPENKLRMQVNRTNLVDVYLKLNDGASEKLIGVDQVTNLSMERANESNVNPSSEYVPNLPGAFDFKDIQIHHIFTRDAFFLKWLTNGVTQGGAARADIEIHIHPTPKTEYVFTCYDAFPVGWQIGKLSLGGSSEVLYEDVTLTFSYMKFDVKVQ